MTHRMKVIRSGSGLFAYLPAALVKEMGIREGDAFMGTAQGERLVAVLRTLNAEALIAALTEHNQHAEDGE
ncbi:hypothetical protein Dcar01_01839 [Deinococcus carri]|uniref:SpoVT-AbrB domain-containing protein n=1 Tax=Deinococcus carri TaxID=1211323 RepID=A0ABP9WAR8_9DEIO